MADAGLLPVCEALQQIWDGSTLGASFTVEFYETGTSTALKAYPTMADAEADTNSFTSTTADTAGRIAVYGAGSTAYKIIVKDASGTQVKEIAKVNFIPGSTVLLSKTPSEYQIAFFENVAGSYKLTNAQTEGTYDFKYSSTGITLGGDKKFFLRDDAIYLHSPSDGQGDLVADSIIQITAPTVNIEASTALTLESDAITLGEGGAADVVLTFNTDGNDGVITWMNSEDYFKLSDDILMDTTKNIYLKDVNSKIYHDTVNINITDDARVTLTAPALTFGDGSNDIVCTFYGANDGVFTWDGANDQFEFADKVVFDLLADFSTTGIKVPLSESNVSNPPTDAEITTAFGEPDGQAGFIGLLDDGGGGAAEWLVASTGNANWLYVQLTDAA